MKHIQLFFILLISFLSINIYGQSQFDIDAQVRPRFEHRNGYKLLPVKDADAANFISQRTRLIFAYSQDKLKFKVALNNVRIWGDEKTLSDDDDAIAFHEAWAEAFFSNNFSVRLGRQEIVYDDHRIFGSVNWAQQGRSHDAMILKLKLSDISNLDFGFALNSTRNEDNKFPLVKEDYDLQYKAFQYLHYNNKFGKFGLGLLLLNNGVEYTNSDSELETDYSQTIGGRLTFKEGKFSADASTYFQTGKISGTDVKANNYALNLKYKVLPELTIGAGYECLSGNDDSSDIKAFTPLYGTNHKFNGWMDYFYVGNWTNSVGLKDLNFVVSYKKDKFNAAIIPHFFSAASDMGSVDEKLGTEIDFTVGYKVAKNIGLSAGISFMSGTDTLNDLQGGGREDNGTFAYVQFVFNPKLFTTKKK